MSEFDKKAEHIVVTPEVEGLILDIAEKLSRRDIANGDDIHQQVCIRGISLAAKNPEISPEELEPMLASAMAGERSEFYRAEKIAYGVSRNTQDALRSGSKTEHELVAEGRTIGVWKSLDSADHKNLDQTVSERALNNVLIFQMINCFDTDDPKESRLKYVLTEYYFEDRTLPEIGEDLGVSFGRVSQLLSEAKQFVRDHLDIYAK